MINQKLAAKMASLFDLSSMLQSDLEAWNKDFLTLYRTETGYADAIEREAATMDKDVKSLAAHMTKLIEVNSGPGAVKIGTQYATPAEVLAETPDAEDTTIAAQSEPDFTSQVTQDPPQDIVKETQKKRIAELETELASSGAILAKEYQKIEQLKRELNEKLAAMLEDLRPTPP